MRFSELLTVEAKSKSRKVERKVKVNTAIRATRTTYVASADKVQVINLKQQYEGWWWMLKAKSSSNSTYLLWLSISKDVKFMGRKKVTTSLGAKCLQLIDHYAVTTGFESRSRVIEETVFAVTELLGHRRVFAQNAQQLKENPSKEEIMRSLLYIGDILSRFGAVLDRFERFTDVPLTQTVAGKKYRHVPPQERDRIAKSKE